MSVPAIGQVAAALPAPPRVDGPTGASQASGASFASALSNGLDQLQATQAKADGLAVQAATGSLTNVQDYLAAATEASLATQLTAAIRNRAVDAFTEIMRMQV
ncbi:MAG: flagellar hook-basal body complex protein FliE [Actinobacteria bacterium]|nr:flagellar hook-basal body complex protein FliE [Actinomycetota bacterium]